MGTLRAVPRIACFAISIMVGRGSALAGPATVPAEPAQKAVAATQSATKPAGDAKAQAAERHKNADPRWIEFQRQQRDRLRDHWPSVAPVATLKPGALVSIKMAGDRLEAKILDMDPASVARIEVEGSKAVWTLMRSRAGLVRAGRFGRQGPFAYVSRYDFDADEEDPWSSRLTCSDRTISLSSQSIYGTVGLVQIDGGVTLTVNEFTQWGQAAANVLSAQAASLPQLRADHPAEFRKYVLPLLEKFSEIPFLSPGPGDVYAVFTEIPAEAKISAQLEALLPDLDADNPADRDAASTRLAHLGAPGVLAALRLDASSLSEEQKLRLRNFVAANSRMGLHDPLAARHDAAFLADCLEFDDAAVRAAARKEIEKRLGHPIAFDTALSGPAAGKAADEIRKELTPPSPPPSTAPATQPQPQV